MDLSELNYKSIVENAKDIIIVTKATPLDEPGRVGGKKTRSYQNQEFYKVRKELLGGFEYTSSSE